MKLYYLGQAAQKDPQKPVEDSGEEKKRDTGRKFVDFERVLGRIEEVINDRLERLENRYIHALSLIPRCHKEIIEIRRDIDVIREKIISMDKQLKRLKS